MRTCRRWAAAIHCVLSCKGAVCGSGWARKHQKVPSLLRTGTAITCHHKAEGQHVCMPSKHRAGSPSQLMQRLASTTTTDTDHHGYLRAGRRRVQRRDPAGPHRPAVEERLAGWGARRGADAEAAAAAVRDHREQRHAAVSGQGADEERNETRSRARRSWETLLERCAWLPHGLGSHYERAA